MKKLILLSMVFVLCGCSMFSDSTSLKEQYDLLVEEGKTPDVESMLENIVDKMKWDDSVEENLKEIEEMMSEQFDNEEFKESKKSLQEMLEDYLDEHFDMEVEPLDTPWGGLGS